MVTCLVTEDDIERVHTLGSYIRERELAQMHITSVFSFTFVIILLVLIGLIPGLVYRYAGDVFYIASATSWGVAFTITIIRYYIGRLQRAVTFSNLMLRESIAASRHERRNVRSYSSSTSYATLMQKREEFTKTPKIFYYLDRSVVESLHNQIVSSVRTKEIITESGKGTSRGVTLELPVISPQFESKQTNMERRKAEVVESAEKQFDDILIYLLDHDLAKIGFEEFMYDKATESQFLSTCQEIKESFEFEVPKNVMEEFIKINKHKYVESRLQEIKSLSGYILMSGEFDVALVEEEWTIVYEHPVSEAMNSGEKKHVTFKASCPSTEMTKIGVDTFRKTNKAKLVLLGNIITFDEGNLRLVVRPIALYS